jgi:hypothetical protein
MKKEKLILKFLPCDQAASICVGLFGCLLFYIAYFNDNIMLMVIGGVIADTALIYSIYSFLKMIFDENNN